MHIQTPCSKTHKILKLNDLIQLNQSTFVRQYKNGKLPLSFTNFFQNIPFEEQKSRDDDYNLKKQTNIALLHFPSCRIVRGWNQNNLLLKSEADLTAFKEDFIQKKLNSYDEECSKPNCTACRTVRQTTNRLPPQLSPNFLPNFHPTFSPTFSQFSPQLKPPMSTH